MSFRLRYALCVERIFANHDYNDSPLEIIHKEDMVITINSAKEIIKQRQYRWSKLVSYFRCVTVRVTLNLSSFQVKRAKQQGAYCI